MLCIYIYYYIQYFYIFTSDPTLISDQSGITANTDNIRI